MILAGQSVLITAAKGGLGSFVTQAFLDAGAAVYGTSRSIQDADFPNPNFTAIPGELNSVEAARAVASRLPRIDAAVHLLGAFAFGPTLDQASPADLDKMLDINLRSAFYLAAAVIPRMRDQGYGRLLAIGSRSALDPSPNTGPYNIAKAALLALVRTLAIENASHGITANLVLPGTMDTPANRAAMPDADPKAWVQPADVAALLVHLASPAGAAINGAAIPIFGAA